MLSPQRTVRVRDTVGIAGWLFADLLLGLAMLFLVFNTVGSQTPPVAPRATDTPAPTCVAPLPTPTPLPPPPTPTPAPTCIPCPPVKECRAGMELVPVMCTFTISDINGLISGSKPTQKVADQVKAEVQRCYSQYKGQSVAGVVFTSARAANAINTGFPMAERINALLPQALPEVFGATVYKAVGYQRPPYGEIEIEVYFIITY